jgi:hypothetical protein
MRNMLVVYISFLLFVFPWSYSQGVFCTRLERALSVTISFYKGTTWRFWCASGALNNEFCMLNRQNGRSLNLLTTMLSYCELAMAVCVFVHKGELLCVL